jgi:hypothetical protein
VVVVRFAVLVEPVPQGDRDPEEALAGDQPVAVEPFDPVLVAVAHVVGEPGELLAAGEEGLAAVEVTPAVADVPLAAGDDLQRPAAPLVELDRVGDRADLAVEVARLAEQVDHRRLRLADGQPGQRGVGDPGRVTRQPVGDRRREPSVATDHAARRQVEFPPPRHVGRVTERADHRDARPLVGLGQRVGHHRNFDAEHRRPDRGAEQTLVPLVVGVGDEGDAADDELRAGRVDQHRPVGGVEPEQVVGALALAVLDLRLGDGGAVVDVPERRRLSAVRLVASEVVQERPLARAPADVVDRRVQERPVVGEAEAAEGLFEHGLVDGRQALAQLDEVRARHRNRLVVPGHVTLERRLEVTVVRLRRVAPDAVEVLHPSLGGEPVVVPADREEHHLAGHPLVADEAVGLGVAEHGAHVDRAGHRRWRGVDDEHLGAVAPVEAGTVEAVHALGLPPL